MNHLSQEELVMTYYAEPDAIANAAHLAECDACRGELEHLR